MRPVLTVLHRTCLLNTYGEWDYDRRMKNVSENCTKIPTTFVPLLLVLVQYNRSEKTIR